MNSPWTVPKSDPFTNICDMLREEMDIHLKLGKLYLTNTCHETLNHLKECKKCSSALEARKHVQQLLRGRLL
jgi:hypothetical protein